MSGGIDEDKGKGKKPTLLLRLPKPFDLDLSVGRVKVNYLTSKGDVELRKLAPDLDHATDEDVCRAYVGIVCEIPSPDPNTVERRRLSEAELASLSRSDLESFAAAYLKSSHQVAATGTDGPAIQRMALSLRKERKSSDETMKKAQQYLSGALSARTLDLINQTTGYAEMLKAATVGLQRERDWQSMASGAWGPMDQIKRDLMGGGAAGVLEEIAHSSDVQFGINEELKRAAEGFGYDVSGKDALGNLVNPGIVGSDGLTGIHLPNVRIPALTKIEPFNVDVSKTPDGRTAAAVESLNDTATTLAPLVRNAAGLLASLAETSIALSLNLDKNRKEDLAGFERGLALTSRNLNIATWTLIASVALGFLTLIVTALMWRDANHDAHNAAEAMQLQSKAQIAELSAIRQAVKSIANSPNGSAPWMLRYGPRDESVETEPRGKNGSLNNGDVPN